MLPLQKLPPKFYESEDVVAIAKALLGKVMVSDYKEQYTAGRIVETEAYAGVIDKASHAYKGRTGRTAVMFDTTGTAYIYLCYGLHQMFNVVTGPVNTAHAILVRAIEPIMGEEIMALRTAKKVGDKSITRGPGNVGKALGLHKLATGTPLQSTELFIGDDGYKVADEEIIASPRIGVAYAAEHAAWPYRFYIKGNAYVSGKNNL